MVEMTPERRRLCYIVVCAIIVVLWIWLGNFEAIEAPYVRF